MNKENNISNQRVSNSYQNDILYGNASSNAYKPYKNLFYSYLTDYAGVNEDISLTITRIKNKKNSSNFANEKWDLNSAGFLKDDNYLWVFKETFNSASVDGFISNAFCFSGQKLRVYIEPTGHISGYVGDKWVYAKTEISVVGTDLFSGNQTQLATFSDFDSQEYSSSRYFNINLPQVSNLALSNYNISGIYIVTLNIYHKLYKDMSFNEVFNDNANINEQHNLQILLFSCSNEAKNVANSFNLFTQTINGNETFNQLFDKSIFTSYNGVDSVPLTDDQKRAVIADQIAALFMSQHPVATSEHYPCKMLGFGVEEAIAPKYLIDKAYTYTQRHPDIIPMINSRMYGMFLNYKSFALSSELDKYFSVFNQSSQYIKDPSRIIAIKEDGKLDKNFGVEGLLFNPFNIESVNADIPKHINKKTIFNISLKNKNVEIDTIQITDPDLFNNSNFLTTQPFDNLELSYPSSCPSIDFTKFFNPTSPSVDIRRLYVKSINTDVLPSYDGDPGGYFDFIVPYGTRIDWNYFSNQWDFKSLKTHRMYSYQKSAYIDTYVVWNSSKISDLFGSPVYKCYFTIEGETSNKKWQFTSVDLNSTIGLYNLTGQYNLSSYSSKTGEPNPYAEESSIRLYSLGDLNSVYQKYKPFEKNKVKVAFKPISGEKLIKKIRYSIWTIDTLQWMEYVDTTGTSRSHVFDLSNLGGVGIKKINNIYSPCGVINVKIDIEDAYGFVNSFYQDYFIPDDKNLPSILSISGSQSLDGSGFIDIFYNYLGTSEINNTLVNLEYSLNNQT